MDRHQTISGAIGEAMREFFEEGELRPHNPAICRDSRGFYFGSALHGDEVVIDLGEGFGNWEPENTDGIEAAATAWEKEIVEAGMAELDEFFNR